MLLCDRHNKITVRKQDGSRKTIVRCADPGCVHFTKEVTEEDCRECPRHLQSKAEVAAALAAQRAAVPKMPTFTRRVVTYSEALAGWFAAGRPERSDEETHRIFHQFCKTCSWFDRGEQVCRGCGCNVNDYRHAILNKIKMATQHCPRNLW